MVVARNFQKILWPFQTLVTLNGAFGNTRISCHVTSFCHLRFQTILPRRSASPERWWTASSESKWSTPKRTAPNGLAWSYTRWRPSPPSISSSLTTIFTFTCTTWWKRRRREKKGGPGSPGWDCLRMGFTNSAKSPHGTFLCTILPEMCIGDGYFTGALDCH